MSWQGDMWDEGYRAALADLLAGAKGKAKGNAAAAPGGCEWQVAGDDECLYDLRQLCRQ